MAAQRDIVILGAGHNALVTAFYLAKKGHKPFVLERRDVVGGSAVTEEFFPGFKLSTVAHASGPLLSEIANDMQLARHGLQMIEPAARLFAPSPDGSSVTFFSDHRATQKQIDRARIFARRGFHQHIDRLAHDSHGRHQDQRCDHADDHAGKNPRQVAGSKGRIGRRRFLVIASEAKQSSVPRGLDCFVTLLLAMTTE